MLDILAFTTWFLAVRLRGQIPVTANAFTIVGPPVFFRCAHACIRHQLPSAGVIGRPGFLWHTCSNARLHPPLVHGVWTVVVSLVVDAVLGPQEQHPDTARLQHSYNSAEVRVAAVEEYHLRTERSTFLLEGNHHLAEPRLVHVA